MEKQKKILKTILYNKGNSGGITMPYIKIYLSDTVMETAFYCHKNRDVDQWNWIEDTDIKTHTYDHLVFFDKEAKIIQ